MPCDTTAQPSLLLSQLLLLFLCLFLLLLLLFHSLLIRIQSLPLLPCLTRSPNRWCTLQLLTHRLLPILPWIHRLVATWTLTNRRLYEVLWEGVVVGIGIVIGMTWIP